MWLDLAFFLAFITVIIAGDTTEAQLTDNSNARPSNWFKDFNNLIVPSPYNSPVFLISILYNIPASLIIFPNITSSKSSSDKFLGFRHTPSHHILSPNSLANQIISHRLYQRELYKYLDYTILNAGLFFFPTRIQVLSEGFNLNVLWKSQISILRYFNN